jgi:hypothetical protein
MPRGPLHEYEEALGRGLGKIFVPPARWMGGMSPAPRLPPVDRAGGTYFSNIFKMVPLFKFNFLTLFLKKVFGRELCSLFS